MTSEEYGQYIDDFELGADVMPGENLTDYIERRRREFESKANGGSIGIEVLFGPKRDEFSIGGRARPTAGLKYDSRANVEDFTKALRSVSGGTTYQQQADAQRYARNKANEMLTAAIRSGNQAGLQSIYQGISPSSLGRMQFNRSGNRITSVPATGPGRDKILNAMAQQMLNTTPSYRSLKPQPRDNLGLLMSETLVTDKMRSPAEMEAIRQKVLAAQKAQEQSYFMTDPVTGKKYSSEAEAIDDLGLVTYNQRFADGGKVPAAPSQLVSESDILLGYRGDDAARSDMASGRSAGRADPGGGVDRSAVSGGSQYAKNVMAQNIANQNKKNKIDTAKNVYGIISPFVNPKSTLGKVKKAFDLYNVYDQFKNIEPTIKDVTLDIDPGLRADLTKSQKKALGTQKMGYEMGLFSIDDVRKNIEPLGNPDKPATNEEIKEFFQAKDGGRVGLFMGGPALEGTALNIYNSMNAYGFSDQEIANALQERGLYTPPGSDSGTPPPQASQPIGARDDDQDRTFVDRQDYSFNKKNYEPGKQLEINPAAFGISFEKASSPQGIINQALEMPGRTLTSFASPTTGRNITGPAEEGFMSQVVDIDPAGRTREELRQQYDSYNRFLGAPSNYAAARTPGKFGQVLGTVVGAAAGIPFVGAGIDALSKMGGKDRSDRSLYAVDNVGFGQGTGRDEFGVFTGGKTLLGDTTSYGERMAERLGELDDFFGKKFDEKGFGTFDINNLDDATLSKMKGINSFYAKQVQAYQQRLERDRINKAAELEKQRQQYLDSQTRKEVQDLQNRINRGDFDSTSSIPDRDRGNVTTASAAKTSKVGGGGYTKSDSTRDSYRGRYNRGGLATMFTRRR